MNTSKFSYLAGVLIALGFLSTIKPANAITFNFSATLNGTNYSGSLDFSGTGTNLQPLLNSSTVLTQYQGNTVNTAATSFTGNPRFNVTSNNVTIASNGQILFGSTGTLGFISSSSTIIDLSTLDSGSVTFTSVPFDFSPIEGIEIGLPLFIGLRTLKKHNFFKKKTSKLQEITS